MSDFRNFLNKQLEDPEFKAEWEALQPELSLVQAMIDARKVSGLTQKELSERTGIAQADISKLENGNANPSLRTLQRLAIGCTCPKEFPVCVCGGKAMAKLITRKPIEADKQELEENRRSRSAHLRVLEKL